jgi:hypothetical protein
MIWVVPYIFIKVHTLFSFNIICLSHIFSIVFNVFIILQAAVVCHVQCSLFMLMNHSLDS